MLKGKLITFEGGEGSGKSTQIKLLCKTLSMRNIEFIKTREPGGTKSAELIRDILVTGEINQWEKITEATLHTAARSEHVQKLIKPSLLEGKHVICDRFIDSTIAYQAYGHGLDVEFIIALHKLVIGDLMPDLTIILDVDPKTGLMRANRRKSNENRYERMGLDFHYKVQDGFRNIANINPDRCVLIDASKPLLTIEKQIMEIIDKHI